MREIKMQPVPDGDLRSPSDKHELHITRGSMTNVVSLTDDELAALRRALAAYRPEVHNGHYGVPAECADPDCGIPEHHPTQNPDYGAPKPFTFGGHENHPVYLHTTCGTIVDVDTSDTSDDSMWSAVLRGDCDCESGGEWRQVYIGAVAQNPAYGAPLCTPGRRIDHEHSVACGPMAGECVTPGHVHVRPESTVHADNGCVTYGAPGAPDTWYGPTGHPIDPVVCINALGADCGPSDCVLDHAMDASPVVTYSTVRDILRDVQAEVDAFAVGTGTQTLPYVEVIRMIRRVAIARGTAL